jgi:hypothetical protein
VTEALIRSLDVREMPNGCWKVRVNEHAFTLTPLLGLLLAVLGSLEAPGPDLGIVPFKTAEQLIAAVSKHRRKRWTERGLAQSLTRLRDMFACHVDGAHLVERSAADTGYRLQVPPTVGKQLKAVLAARLAEILNRETRAAGPPALR